MGYIDRLLAFGERLSHRVDSWQNLYTGLGTSRDKTTYGAHYKAPTITDAELSSLYHQHDMARRIVAIRPAEALRKPFAVKVQDDTELASEVRAALDELDAFRALRDAWTWGRLYGGGAVILGADDGQNTYDPLDVTKIRSFEWLRVVDRRYMTPEVVQGKPTLYQVSSVYGHTKLVHVSRMILFGGAHTSEEERLSLGGWDYSVLQSCYEQLRQFDSSWKASEHLMADASQGVFKIAGLLQMIAGGEKEALQTRMQLVDMSRSVARSLLLDASEGEEFTREHTSFTDAANMLDKFMLRLAAAAEIPVTILMGQSPAGMNATGDSDFRWFYDSIASEQQLTLKPRARRLVEVLLHTMMGADLPESWGLSFPALWQPTALEQATIEKTTAEKDVLYIREGVITPEEVAASRYRPEGWDASTQIDLEAREEMARAEAEALRGVSSQVAAAAPKLAFAPTSLDGFTTLNEARASQGLPPWPGPEDGNTITVAEFRQLREQKGQVIGTSEGERDAQGA